jgi:hypothetical protein
MPSREVPHESPSQLAHYLHGVHLPASKADLKAEAKKNHSPPDMLKLIDKLPERSFQTMPDIMKAVGEVEGKSH